MGIVPISAHLFQENDLPDGAAILGAVARARLDPVALGVLRLQASMDGRVAHNGGLGLDSFGVVGGTVQQITQGEKAHGWIFWF
jgi:hypothetical protein